MMGESLTETEVTEAGITGDRIWAVRDETRGGIRGGKKIPQLMTLGAASGTDAPRITAPDGDSAAANSENINEWLSDKLNHPVSLWPLLPATQLDHYRRGAPDTEDFELELRTVFGRLPSEPIPDLSGFEELLEFESPPGTYFDAFPVSFRFFSFIVVVVVDVIILAARLFFTLQMFLITSGRVHQLFIVLLVIARNRIVFACRRRLCAKLFKRHQSNFPGMFELIFDDSQHAPVWDG